MCTIGALILLLILVASQMREDTVAKARTKKAESAQPLVPTSIEPAPIEIEVTEPEPELALIPIPEASLPITIAEPEPLPAAPPEARPAVATAEQLAQLDALNRKSQSLAQALKEEAGRFNSVTEKSKVLQAELSRVTSEKDTLSNRIEQLRLTRLKAESRSKEMQVEKAQLVELIDQSSEMIDKQRRELGSPKFAIIPYDGQTGTTRRPVILECVRGEIRFASEGVTVPVARLEPFGPEQNPLLAGLYAVFQYWSEKAQSSRDPSANPYALLIIRPDGVESSDAARLLLDTLADSGNLGYELVESSFEFAPLPAPDDVKQRCREAVEAAYQIIPKTPSSVLAMRRDRGTGLDDVTDDFGGPGGSPNGAGPRDGGPNRRSTADLRDPFGEAANRRALAQSTAPIDVGRLVHGPVASNSFFDSVHFRQRSPGDSSGEPNGQIAGYGQFGAPGSDRATDPRNSRLANGQPGGTGPNSVQPGSAGRGVGATDFRQPDFRQPDFGESGPNQPGGRQPDSSSFEGKPVGSGSSTGTSDNQPRLLDAGSGALAQQLPRDPETGASTSTGNALAQRLVPSDNPSQKPGGSAAGGHWTSSSKASSTGTDTGSPDAQSVNSSSNPAAGSTGQAGSGSESSPASGPPSSSFMKSLPQPAGSSGKQPGIDLPEEEPPRIFKARRRWGVPDQPGKIPLEHDIDLTIKPGEVVFDGRFRVVKKPGWTTEDLVKQSIEALDVAARDWGQPPGAFFWVPNVKLKTQPGGEPISQHLTRTLTEAGASAKEAPR